MRRWPISSVFVCLFAALLAALPCLQAQEEARRPKNKSRKAAAAAAETQDQARPVREEVAEAVEQAEDQQFVRVRRDAKGRPLALETAIVHYQLPARADGTRPTVDLIGAVHVGEDSYYTDLNARFTKYDAMLFELVAPEGFELKEGEKLESRSAVGALQNGLKSMLGLEFQLEKVDYSKPNFVHADMSPEEFRDTMKERGESFFTMLLRMMSHSMNMQAAQKGPSDLEIIVALLRRDRARLKSVMAEQLEGMEDMITAVAGADGSSTIITERNKKALEVLRRELAAGKDHVAIFYGAGHLSDFDARLLKEFGAKRVKHEWITAWDLTRDHSR